MTSQTSTVNGVTSSYIYNEAGLRTSKTVGTDATIYTYKQGQLAGVQTSQYRLNFHVDPNGQIAGFTCRMADGAQMDYTYVKNQQGDILAVIDPAGAEAATYTYDAWGRILSVGGYDAGLAERNPLRYRGYIYDSETGLYYVSSRYYDPEIGRFINADNVINGTGESVQGYNLYVYCFNNPVNMSDPSGSWPKWIENSANWLNKNIVQPIKNMFSKSNQSNIVMASSHDINRRPYKGEPGSTYTAPNGDSRTYGSDGTPKHDYDHNDHGYPDKHPHDLNGGHNHDWENGVRGPAYSRNWEPIVGTALVTVCVIGIVVVAADDVTGIGVADNVLFGPLGTGVGEGLILIFR